MIELTEQQRQELSSPEPAAIDPQTRQIYVLVCRETYERLKALLALDEYDPDEGAAYINEVMADDDAKDPYLESYQITENRHEARRCRSRALPLPGQAGGEDPPGGGCPERCGEPAARQHDPVWQYCSENQSTVRSRNLRRSGGNDGQKDESQTRGASAENTPPTLSRVPTC